MEQGISQVELAKRIGVNEMTIVNWEVKDMTPCSRYLEKLRRIMPDTRYGSKRFMLTLEECS